MSENGETFTQKTSIVLRTSPLSAKLVLLNIVLPLCFAHATERDAD